MPDPAPATGPAAVTKTMEAIVALCRRRGFIFQSSEIYGGINGFWDYGPLGVELKRNLKDAWWHDIVRCPARGPDGNLIDMVGLDCSIIMNPKVWVASGHAAGFADPMSTCRQCKKLYRSDHVWELLKDAEWVKSFAEHVTTSSEFKDLVKFNSAAALNWAKTRGRKVAPGLALVRNPEVTMSWLAEDLTNNPHMRLDACTLLQYMATEQKAQTGLRTPCPNCGGDLTEPRQFNLMFKTQVGAVSSDDDYAYLRPETAQGIFANFRNVVDTSRVKVPFGIAQIGKAFRNEVTPRNFTFRSREFEQMEIEFFIRPDTAKEWYQFWRDARFKWWQSVGITSTHLQLREHDKDELSHYAKEGAGTSDIEYRFPFTDPGFGELEGVAHRTDFDLRAHAEHSGLKDKLKYFDQELQVKLQGRGMAKEEIAAKSKYFPHVIEPSAGADRGTLAVLCEAFTPDPARPSGVVMKFHPRLAPIKAAIYPLVAKDGMPEVAEKLYLELRQKYAVETDAKQSIGKRYARMDEAGTPYCFTIDGETLTTQTVTVRHRDSLQQERVGLDKVSGFLAEKIGG